MHPVTINATRVQTAAVVLLLAGCAAPGVPERALRLDESALEVRAMQTRMLAAPSEAAILAASVAVLQDMEFNVDRVERPLGVLSASKMSDADDPGEKTGLFFLQVLCAATGGGDCDQMSTAKDEQQILLTMVVLPSLVRDGDYSVRVTIQRVIYDKQERVRTMERITAPEPYVEVFDNLRRALNLEIGDS